MGAFGWVKNVMFVLSVTVKERPMIPAVGSHVYVIGVMDMAVFVKLNHLKKNFFGLKLKKKNFTP